MSDVRYRRKMIDGAPVVAAPAEIDITTADQSRAACGRRTSEPRSRRQEARLSPHAELQALSDNALLARLRRLPRGSAEREAICEILLSRYAGLVRSCLRPYQLSPEPAEDLLQAGYVGLLKAINGFDRRYGDSLATYAAPCISGEIKRHFRDRRSQIRVRRQDQELPE